MPRLRRNVQERPRRRSGSRRPCARRSHRTSTGWRMKAIRHLGNPHQRVQPEQQRAQRRSSSCHARSRPGQCAASSWIRIASTVFNVAAFRQRRRDDVIAGRSTPNATGTSISSLCSKVTCRVRARPIDGSSRFPDGQPRVEPPKPLRVRDRDGPCAERCCAECASLPAAVRASSPLPNRKFPRKSSRELGQSQPRVTPMVDSVAEAAARKWDAVTRNDGRLGRMRTVRRGLRFAPLTGRESAGRRGNESPGTRNARQRQDDERDSRRHSRAWPWRAPIGRRRKPSTQQSQSEEQSNFDRE